MKRLALPFLMVLPFLIGIPSSGAAAPGQGQRRPAAIGTFIQWYLVKDWSDAKWRAEFRAMREVGMRHLVFTPCADGKPCVAYYPTHIPGYKLADGCGDLVDACLRNAQKAGIRVFLGLNFHNDWWVKAASDPGWLSAQMIEGNAVADELYRRYRTRYPQAFYGWYWVWEVDNLNFQKPKQREVLAHALDINVRHLKALNPQMPVLLCPFMNAESGAPEAYRAMWEYVFANCALGRGDIFCPQDCVGAGGLKLEQVPAWFAALRKAVDVKPGLRFWSDVETFSQEDWTSATLDRFVAQMRAEQPYVEQYLTFAYSHYYSPITRNAGFQKTYLQYLRTGKLETNPPTAPTGLHSEQMPDGSVRLSWDAAQDDVGVCGYALFRNGVRIARMQNGRPEETASHLTFLDAKAPPDQNLTYTVQAYDFAGNFSPKVETVVRRTAAR